MKLYDISRELLSAPLYPGSTQTRLIPVTDMARGELYNSTNLYCSAHAATHADAFKHFIGDGLDMESMPLEHYYGPCYVLTVPEAKATEAAYLREHLPPGTQRLLLKTGGLGFLTADAAHFLADEGVLTVGTDALSVGSPDTEAAVHLPLLSRGVAILEQLDLSCVEEGPYVLCAFPLKIRGGDGAPCRAVLIAQET